MAAYSRLSKYCLILLVISVPFFLCAHLTHTRTYTEEACCKPNLKVTSKFVLGSLRVKETLTVSTVNKTNRMQKMQKLCYSPFKATKTRVRMTHLIQPALFHTSDFAYFLSALDSDNHYTWTRTPRNSGRFLEEEVHFRNALGYHGGFLQIKN